MPLTQTRPTQNASGLSIADERFIQLGEVVQAASGAPRLGIFPAHTNPIVTSLASMAVSVGIFVAACSRTGTGVEFVANNGSTTVALSAAPASNSRIDVVWVRPQFVASSDAGNSPLFGVTAGTAAASPVKPTIPAGALELATVLIPSTATTTQSAGVVITQTFLYTAMTGGTVLFRNATEMTSFAPAEGQNAWRLDLSQQWVYDGSNWTNAQPGLVLIRPGNVTGGSVSADGTIVPTVGGNNVRLDDIFSTRYRHYRIVGSFLLSAMSNLRMNLTSGGVARTNAVYFGAGAFTRADLTPQNGQSYQWHEGATNNWFMQTVESSKKVLTLDIFNPAVATENTFASGVFGSFGGAYSHQSWSGSHEANNANDGLYFFVSTGGGVFQAGCNLKVYAYA